MNKLLVGSELFGQLCGRGWQGRGIGVERACQGNIVRLMASWPTSMARPLNNIIFSLLQL